MIICFTEKDDPVATPSSETKTQKVHTEKQTLPVVTVKLKESVTEKTDTKNLDENEEDPKVNEKDTPQDQDKKTKEEVKENNENKVN